MNNEWEPIDTAPEESKKGKLSILLYTKYGLMYCGRYRYGNLGEPTQDVLAWRCDSSGRYANPIYWTHLPPKPSDKVSDYKQIVTKIPKNEGGGYSVHCKELGFGVVGDGETELHAKIDFEHKLRMYLHEIHET